MSIVDLEPFEGETFVAYLDISGFKEGMKLGVAKQALEDLNQIGFDVISEYNQSSSNTKVAGIFISDCAIIFIRFGGGWEIGLQPLLESIKKINLKMLEKNHLTTCCIAYGDFNYQHRTSSLEVRKNPIIGDGYLNAYLDNEIGTPKIQPGDCRVVIKGAPFASQSRSASEIESEDKSIYNSELERCNNTLLENLKLFKRGQHYYYYWMLNDTTKITEYIDTYKEINNQKYFRIKEMIKRYAFGTHTP